MTNHSQKFINEQHKTDLKLASECLESNKTTIEDKQDAVREKIASEVLLQAFNEQRLPKSYQELSRSRERLKLANKAKMLLGDDNYITVIAEWYQKEHGIDDAIMPSVSQIATSVRKEVPQIIQALFETLPRKNNVLNLDDVDEEVVQEFFMHINEDKDEFELEEEFEAFLKEKERKNT